MKDSALCELVLWGATMGIPKQGYCSVVEICLLTPSIMISRATFSTSGLQHHAPSAHREAANPLLYLCLHGHPLQRSNWYWSKHICVPLPDICSVKRSGFCSGDKSRLPHYHILLQISIPSSKVSSDFSAAAIQHKVPSARLETLPQTAAVMLREKSNGCLGSNWENPVNFLLQ